jgi:hypothetical protein
MESEPNPCFFWLGAEAVEDEPGPPQDAPEPLVAYEKRPVPDGDAPRRSAPMPLPLRGVQ